MNIFSDENIQQVLETLFELATDKGNVPAIKLYLELANDQVPQDALTLEQVIQIVKTEDCSPSVGVLAPPESEATK